MRISELIHKVKKPIHENQGQSMRLITKKKGCLCLKRQSEGVFIKTFDTNST